MNELLTYCHYLSAIETMRMVNWKFKGFNIVLMQNLSMYNLFLTAIIGSVLIAGVAFSPLLSGQFHLAYAQDNATTMLW